MIDRPLPGPARIGSFGRACRALTTSLAFIALLSGCAILDSPTDFTQAAPVQVAGNGVSVIFKSPLESNKCPVPNGTVSFAAVDRQTGPGTVVHLSYQRSQTVPRNDILALTTDAGTLAIGGQGVYRLMPPNAVASWRSLHRLGSRVERVRSPNGASLSVSLRRSGHFLVEARDRQHRDLFVGTLMPVDGKVYVRNASLTSLAASYAGKSNHNCYNWNTAAAATAALGRVVASIPP